MQLNDRQLWVDRFREDRDWQFWIFQLLGWAGYSLVTFFALTVWDDNVSWPHVGHILVQAVLGILCSWPLRPVYARIFETVSYTHPTLPTIHPASLSVSPAT